MALLDKAYKQRMVGALVLVALANSVRFRSMRRAHLKCR